MASRQDQAQHFGHAESHRRGLAQPVGPAKVDGEARTRQPDRLKPRIHPSAPVDVLSADHALIVLEADERLGLGVEGDGEQVPVVQADPDAPEKRVDQQRRLDRNDGRQTLERPCVTMKDVAVEVGVSQSTRSFVFNGLEDMRIRAATRRRVLDSDNKLGLRRRAAGRPPRGPATRLSA